MVSLILESKQVDVPDSVRSLAGFRRWTHSAHFPQTGSIGFLAGVVWVDISPEQLFSHNQVKGEISRVLGSLVRTQRLGRFFPDGVLLTNVDADLSTEPDGLYVSHDRLSRGSVRLVEGKHDEFLELEGSPDLVVEVVSPSSFTKDTVTLRDLYWRAGIPEYWLVDARGAQLQFDILKRRPRGYVTTRKLRGWVKSEVLEKSFRLTRDTDPLGHPEYTLSMR